MEFLKTKKLIVVFLAVIMFLAMVPLESGLFLTEAASQNNMNTAITNALKYLNSTQASDGSWGSDSAPIACTASAVLAFENNNHFGWNSTDPYNSTVQKGLNYLFSKASIQVLTNKTGGNPDTNANGMGLYFYSYNDGSPHYTDEVYQTPMVLTAIIASQIKTQIATTGPANVTGRTYYDIATDIVDWIAWAQNNASAGTARGGWRYIANQGTSDNSVSQWPVMGLIAAGLWGINASAYVRSELQYWVAADQDLTGNSTSNANYGSFGYDRADDILGGVVETASGILELTYLGVPSSNASLVAAEGYINKMWNYYDGGWNVNIGSLYDMYTVMKAMTEVAPSIQFIANYNGTAGVEWFNGANQYADSLVANQSANGSWVNWKNWAEPFPIALSTAFGALILEYIPLVVKFTLTVNVVDANTNSPIPSASVNVVGPQNYTGTADSGTITFSGIQASLSYTVFASKAGYYPASTPITFTNDTEITLQLISSTPPPTPTPTPANKLTILTLDVSVVNSGGTAINDAEVIAGSTSPVYTDASGLATLHLPNGTYDVTASHSGYSPASWTINLNENENITLTLAYPFNYKGKISSTNMNITKDVSGYKIMLYNNLTSSVDVYFEWQYVGTILPGSWQSFSFQHIPTLIVEAASKGTKDYPNAVYTQPIPIALTPTTGTEGAFLAEPVPYVSGSIFVNPSPPIQGNKTTIGITLHNPFNHTLKISRIDFQVSGLTIGGYFTSVGNVSDVSLQIGETKNFTTIWIPDVSGHHCIKVVLVYSPDPDIQAIQRNIDILGNLIIGDVNNFILTLQNPTQTASEMNLVISNDLPSDWNLQITANGENFNYLTDHSIEMPPGAKIPLIISVLPNNEQPGENGGVIDLQGFLNGNLIGGVMMDLHSESPTTTTSQTTHTLSIGVAGLSTGERWAVLINGSIKYPDNAGFVTTGSLTNGEIPFVIEVESQPTITGTQNIGGLGTAIQWQWSLAVWKGEAKISGSNIQVDANFIALLDKSLGITPTTESNAPHEIITAGNFGFLDNGQQWEIIKMVDIETVAYGMAWGTNPFTQPIVQNPYNQYGDWISIAGYG